MILNQPDFFARSATLDGAISDTDTQITLTGLSTRFTDAVAAGTVRYPIGPFRISDDDGFELIAITGHVSGSTFEVERGIQGTTAEAWADGTAVRAVVTRKSLVSETDLIKIPDNFSFGFNQDKIRHRAQGDSVSIGETSQFTQNQLFAWFIRIPVEVTLSAFVLNVESAGTSDGVTHFVLMDAQLPMTEASVLRQAQSTLDSPEFTTTVSFGNDIFVPQTMLCVGLMHVGYSTVPNVGAHGRIPNILQIYRKHNSDTNNSLTSLVSEEGLTDLSSFTINKIDFFTKAPEIDLQIKT